MRLAEVRDSEHRASRGDEVPRILDGAHLVRVLGDGFFVKDSLCFEEGATSMAVLVFVSLHSGASVCLSGD